MESEIGMGQGAGGEGVKFLKLEAMEGCYSHNRKFPALAKLARIRGVVRMEAEMGELRSPDKLQSAEMSLGAAATSGCATSGSPEAFPAVGSRI